MCDNGVNIKSKRDIEIEINQLSDEIQECTNQIISIKKIADEKANKLRELIIQHSSIATKFPSNSNVY
jgi:uncharacterized coiled-coil DUF342 family protein